jgi:hypothetical protein
MKLFFDWKCSYTTAEENYWGSGRELREYLSGGTEENMSSHELMALYWETTHGSSEYQLELTKGVTQQ